MRTDLDRDSEDLFQRRLLEKEAQSEALFSHKNVYTKAFQDYVRQQVFEKHKRITVGKPAFTPKF